MPLVSRLVFFFFLFFIDLVADFSPPSVVRDISQVPDPTVSGGLTASRPKASISHPLSTRSEFLYSYIHNVTSIQYITDQSIHPP
jgi:hypothetical protein